ncbi:MAG: FAD-dependent oxidoreductase [Armatimonadota bacterium]|nr:FAD-dependent oxidoreductase [bacterium]
MNKFDYLIIGNSTAAVGAIEAIRAAGDNGSIGVVAHETEHTYSRPLITYFMAGKVAEENVYYRPGNFYERMGVECMFGRQMKSVDVEGRSVLLEDGERIGYGLLMIAAGGSPIAPPIPGMDRPGVFFMNTMDDARKAKGWLQHNKRAVVIGGGLTGLKTAEALANLGQEVIVVELAPRVLAAAMDEACSELVRQVLVSKGIEILTEVQVTRIDGCDDSNDVCFATLSTGEVISCDTVFMAIGVRPRIELVKDSGIEIGRGILVDRHMRTNIPNVYASGDIAEAFDPLFGGQRVLPILPNAYIGGRVAGMNMTGKEASYNVGMSVNSVNFFGFPFMSAGFATQEEGDGFKVFKKLDGTNYRKIVTRESKLVGMLISGDVERAGLMTGMMRAGVSVEGMEQDLLDGKLGLICLPKDVLEERIHSSGRNWQ